MVKPVDIDIDAPPYIAIRTQFFSKVFLEAVWSEMERKVPIWTSGMDQPTNSERFAYAMLRPQFGRVEEKPEEEV